MQHISACARSGQKQNCSPLGHLSDVSCCCTYACCNVLYLGVLVPCICFICNLFLHHIIQLLQASLLCPGFSFKHETVKDCVGGIFNEDAKVAENDSHYRAHEYSDGESIQDAPGDLKHVVDIEDDDNRCHWI